MNKWVFTILFLSTNVLAAKNETSQFLYILAILAVVFGILSLSYTYKQTQGKKGLDAVISKNKKIILKQREEIQANKTLLGKQTRNLTGNTEKVVDRLNENLENVGYKSGQLRDEYWDRVEQIEVVSDGMNEIEKLEVEKKEIEGLIELSKAKYHTRALDEAGFNEITREYQKKIIEIESKLDKLKKKEEEL